MKKLSSVLANRLFFVVFLLILITIAVSGNTKSTNYVANLNNVTSLQTVHIVSKYDVKKEELEVKYASNMNEIISYGMDGPVMFVGSMTAYGADCVGCSGKVSCPPRQDVRNSNIYYNDSEYGKIRILAADSSIPCGTIVKINNVSFSNEEIIAIVLDRGSAIKGTLFDFLVDNESSGYLVGRQKNVNYQIIRWGW